MAEVAAIGLAMPAERHSISLGMAGLLATNQVVGRQEEAVAFFQAPLTFDPADMARAASVLHEDRARLEAAHGLRLPQMDLAQRESPLRLGGGMRAVRRALPPARRSSRGGHRRARPACSTTAGLNRKPATSSRTAPSAKPSHRAGSARATIGPR